MCELRETTASEISRQGCNDLQTYTDTLETSASCNSGEPGKLVWTPDDDTDDLVYYQVLTFLTQICDWDVSKELYLILYYI